jgi:hypothetical protein
LRDASGQKSDQKGKILLDLLKNGVSQGKIVCPISEATFIEILKQAHTPARRIATARLVDELSLGVGLISTEFRAKTEIARFIYANEKRSSLYPLEELVWTKTAYALGYRHPVVDGLSPSELLLLQKGFVDELWGQSFSDLISHLGEIEYSEKTQLEMAARKVAVGIRDNVGTLTTFANLYRDEVGGVVDVYGSAAMDVVDDLAVRRGFVPFPKGSEERKDFERQWHNVLFWTLLSKKMDSALRTMVSAASLHAGLRWNRRTKFEANHFYDFDHAIAAVSYCDAFFTEGFISNLVNSGNVRLGKLNGCRTTADIDEAIEITQDMLNNDRP